MYEKSKKKKTECENSNMKFSTTNTAGVFKYSSSGPLLHSTP